MCFIPKSKAVVASTSRGNKWKKVYYILTMTVKTLRRVICQVTHTLVSGGSGGDAE